MGYLMYAENAETHYMYDRENANGRAELRMYHSQFPDRRMSDHRIFQRSHRQLCETRSLYLIRHDADDNEKLYVVQA
ncbi:hypothetical protein TNCV_2986991 [Trichonephila clavipes]|nr:hypothetical protein TNCV_2986991 [Trichonephila clavipes]